MAVKRSDFPALIVYNILYTCVLWTSLTMGTSKIFHFRSCTSNCSNSSRVLELLQALSNPCSQNELNNPDAHLYRTGTCCSLSLLHSIPQERGGRWHAGRAAPLSAKEWLSHSIHKRSERYRAQDGRGHGGRPSCRKMTCNKCAGDTQNFKIPV
jgi:hypothetical protein